MDIGGVIFTLLLAFFKVFSLLVKTLSLFPGRILSFSFSKYAQEYIIKKMKKK
jgi:hypothetical protein